MQAEPQVLPSGRKRDPAVWHVLLILVVSASYESLFIHRGIGWLFDEGWPLYAAMQLHAGGVLYQDVSFIFPPGHLLSAWLAFGLDPPGIVLARVFYAGFNLALGVAMYFLARRLMRPSFALFGVLLLAIAAPRSHISHLVFGYRYLVFSVLVLLAFARRLDLDASDAARAFRWMLLAGIGAGVMLWFRLTPAFAVSCAIAVGVLANAPDARTCLRDWSAYGLGLAIVLVPVLAWFASTVGLDALWREVVVRPVVMTDVQSLPSLPFSWLPEGGSRRDLFRWFIAAQHRFYGVMYVVYIVGPCWLWVQARRRGTPFRQTLLLATAVWGGIYLLRSLGRADDHHLMSALPPACLILAHGADRVAAAVGARSGAPEWTRRLVALAACTLLLLGWAYAQRVDLFLTSTYRGEAPLTSTGGAIRIKSTRTARSVDRVVRVIRETTGPQDPILDLSAAPLFYVLTERFGPGQADVVSPGIFLDEAEERAFVDRLALRPPAAVIFPLVDFDGMPERGIERTAPRVVAWVRANYREHRVIDRYAILLPKPPPQRPERR